jgi:hypothetical protein
VALAGVATALTLVGCSEAEPTADPPTPTASIPDLASLEVAVNSDEYWGDESGVSESAFIVPADCAAGVRWQGTFYVISGTQQIEGVRDPQPAQRLDGVVIPGCNDTGAILEPDVPTDAWAIQGVDPEHAILVDL